MVTTRTVIGRCMGIDNNMYFSIIVPVYKVEDYIYECLDSILAQRFNDFELILVDDGSPDRCPQICDEYAERDKRVRVIHKKNGGLSSARNAALDVARGDYIVFVDSDDVITHDTLQNMRTALHQLPDVLISEYYSSPGCSLGNMPESLFIIPKSTRKSDVISFVFYKKENTWASVQYIVKRNLIEERHLRFEEGYYHEDVSWTGQLFLYAQTFSYYNKVWYVRRPDRMDSITNVIKPKRTLDTIELISKQIHSSAYSRLSENEKKTIFNQYIRAAFSSMIYYSSYKRKDQLKIAKEAKKNIDIFDYALSKKHRVFVTLMRVIGVDCSMKLYCMFVMRGGKQE